MVVKKRVLIVDDHPLFREGLKNTIARTGTFEVVAEAGRAVDALRLAVEIKPDLVLIDITLPDENGIELTRALRKAVPNTALMIVSVHAATNYISDAFEAGASGYVVKDSVPETLTQALEIVAQGGYYLGGPITGESAHQLKGLTKPTVNRHRSRYESLTRRQREVMDLLIQGLSHKAIGERLCISPRTVEGHRDEIMRALELTNTVDLTRYAVRLGLISPDRSD